MKNIVVINGSPRRGGNTDTLAEAFIKGAKAAGNDVSVINAADMSINPCRGCNACQKSGKCVQKDDMDECCAQMAAADVLAFATPVYFFSVTAQLKRLIDRLHSPVRNTFKVKTLVLLAVGANPNESVFEPVKAMYNAALSHFKLSDGGMIFVGGVKEKGDIAGNPALKQAEDCGFSI